MPAPRPRSPRTRLPLLGLAFRGLDFRGLPAAVIGALLCTLLLGSLPAGPTEGAAARSDIPAATQELLDRLGSERWEDREAATQALLEEGPGVVPALRTLAGSPDPEVRNRVAWLLSILAPPLHTVEVIRLAGRGPVLEPVEWVRLAFPVRARGDGESTQAGGGGRRIGASLEGEVEPLDIHVEIAAERNPLTMRCRAPYGFVALLEEEETFEIDKVAGRISVESTPGLWVTRVRRSGGPTEDPPLDDAASVSAALESWLRASISDGPGSVDEDARRDLWRVAGAWGRLDLLPAVSSVSVTDRLHLALARLRAGDAEPTSLLEDGLRGETPDGAPLDPTLGGEITLSLLERGPSDVAVERIVQRFPDGTLWEQHRASGALLDRLEDPDFTERHGVELLEMLIAAGRIYWQDAQIVALLQRLQDRMPPDVFAETLRPVLADALGNVSNEITGSLGVGVLLRTALRTLRESDTSAEEIVAPLQKLLRNAYHLSEAFAVLRDRREAGDVDDASWAEVRRILVENLETQGNSTILLRTREALAHLAEDPSLAPEDRRQLWLDHLACYEIEGQSIHMQVDRDLMLRYGEGMPPPPRTKEHEPWLARAEEWRAHLTALPAEAFELEPAETGATPLRLTVIDLRVESDTGAISLVDATSRLVTPGTHRSEIDEDLEERHPPVELLDSNIRPGQAQVGRQRVMVDRPSIFPRFRSQWRHTMHVAAAGRLGLLPPNRQREIQYESLILLESLPDPEDEMGARSAAPPPPPEGASPEEVWRWFRGELVRGYESADPPKPFLDAIARYRVEEARDSLVAAYENSPDVDAALALLALGDLRGKDLLLGTIGGRRYGLTPLLEELLRAGVPEALDAGLSLLEEGPVRGVSTYQVIRAIDRSLDDPRLRAHLDEDRLYAALVATLDQNGLSGAVIPILRRRTGLDFGYYESFQILDREERDAAVAATLERWRAWFASRTSAAEREARED